MRAPQEKDGFMEAFRKVANQSTMGLSRKYREVRDHARREMQQGRIGVIGSSAGAPSGATGAIVDESADMFASLAAFSHSDGRGDLPAELRGPLERFYAPQ